MRREFRSISVVSKGFRLRRRACAYTVLYYIITLHGAIGIIII